MKASLVRALPIALLAALAGWTFIDLLRAASLPGGAVVAGIVLIAVGTGVHGSRSGGAPWHRASRALLGAGFVLERLAWAGVDPVPMMGFVVLLMGLGSLHALERTFAPVYAGARGEGVLEKVDAAALGAYARGLALLGFTFGASLFLALLVPLAVLRDASLLGASVLALGVLIVVAFLALGPRRAARKA